MAVVKARDQDVALLARLLRAEAEGEGEPGMMMVGNVGLTELGGIVRILKIGFQIQGAALWQSFFPFMRG